MQEWLQALSLEVDAQGRRIRAAGGGRADGAIRGAAGAQERMVERLGEVRAGLKLGEWARQGASFLQSLPAVSVLGDAATKGSCTDLLAQALRERPHDPLLAVQLVDGLRRAERQRFVVTWARTGFDPSGRLLAEGVRVFGQIGAGQSAAIRLISRAHTQAARRVRSQPGWRDLHALGRVYLASGKPALAAHWSLLAADAARRELAALPAPHPQPPLLDRMRLGWATGGLAGVGAVTALAIEDADERATQWIDERVFADPDELPPRLTAMKREGAALTTAAAAFHVLGARNDAEQAVAAALDRTMTVAREVRAAMVDPEFELGFARRVSARREELDRIALVDRRFYFGAARGDLRVGGSVAVSQTRKTYAWTKRFYDGARKLTN